VVSLEIDFGGDYRGETVYLMHKFSVEDNLQIR